MRTALVSPVRDPPSATASATAVGVGAGAVVIHVRGGGRHAHGRPPYRSEGAVDEEDARQIDAESDAPAGGLLSSTGNSLIGASGSVAVPILSPGAGPGPSPPSPVAGGPSSGASAVMASYTGRSYDELDPYVLSAILRMLDHDELLVAALVAKRYAQITPRSPAHASAPLLFAVFAL
jgi:hypothetical protein